MKVKKPASQAALPIVKDRASWSASAQAATAPPVNQEIHRLPAKSLNFDIPAAIFARSDEVIRSRCCLLRSAVQSV
jgi:hypothetical protein